MIGANRTSGPPKIFPTGYVREHAIKIADALNAPQARNIRAKATLKLADEPDERRLRQFALDRGNEKARRIPHPRLACRAKPCSLEALAVQRRARYHGM